MKITVRADSVTIEGYVNAIERKSKELNERGVHFVERIAEGCFARAIKRAKDIRILLNHDRKRDLGGISDGNLELEEDAIGLKARATIYDPEVIEDARRGNLVGWSFGFNDIAGGVKQLRDEETGLPLRVVSEIELEEVSLLNRKKTPAYKGTLVNVRDDGSIETILLGAENIEEIETTIEDKATSDTEFKEVDEVRDKEDESEAREESEPKEEKPEAVKEVTSEYYASYRNIITELKGLVKKI